MRGNFDLNRAEFSDGSQQQLHIPPKESLELYNQEYCLLLEEARRFFSDCKECIFRLVSLNSLGLRFNLPFMFTTMSCMENKWFANSNTSLEASAKERAYETSFYAILQRMSRLVDDLLDLELDIKKNYMNIECERPKNRVKKQLSFNERVSLNSNESISSNEAIKKTLKQSIIQEEEQKDREHEFKIRQILQEHLKMQEITLDSVCQVKCEPLNNLDRLSCKIDSIKQKIFAQRCKEQKIWETFNKKKPSSYKPQFSMGLKRENSVRLNSSHILIEELSVSGENESTKTKNTMRKKAVTITSSREQVAVD